MLEICGELCDLSKEIQKNPEDVIGTVTAKVNQELELLQLC